MKWDCLGGLYTSVRMNGRLAADPNKSAYANLPDARRIHEIRSMEAVSQYGDEHSRRGEMTLHIGCRGKNLPPNKTSLLLLLETEFEKRSGHGRGSGFMYKPSIRGPETVSWTDTLFTVSFVLGNGEQFCDTAIEVARTVFEALKVSDKTGTHLARFSVNRETFVSLDGAWITFARWLRMSHRLPVWGPEDSLA